MRRLLNFSFLLLIFGYGDVNAQSNQKAKLVQMCLDDIYKSKMFKFFEKSPLILVKNKYSSGLEDLHFGKNRLVLKNIPLSDPRIHVPFREDTGTKCLIIFYHIIDKNKVSVGIDIPGETLGFLLVNKNSTWVIKEMTATLDEPALEPPIRKN